MPTASHVVCTGAVLLSITAFQQQPPQIIINANSSADKTNSFSATERTTSNSRSAQIENQPPAVIAVAPVATAPPKPVPAAAPPTATSPSKVAAAFGTCYWNGAPEQCLAQWSGPTVSVTWSSDGKVTRYDFNAGTVIDTANGKTYKATQVDLAQGCMSTANGRSCIYR
ncbi:hypothetical protein [Prochlorococcus sp. MIT 1306]|uniref:hypothetical protein n=1 Tax=Prochlorococcus sp. MIT 1306 TaxID=1799667 RepID=UPI0018D3A374|nr:hypothetical protein [Prochlorococcus sp. MIT 1306]